MTFRTPAVSRGLAGLIGGLLLAGLAPAATAAPAPGTDVRYVYRAAFTAEASNDAFADYGTHNFVERHLKAGVEGTLAEVQLPEGKVLDPVQTSMEGTVGVTSATARTVASTNDGETQVTCEGQRATAVGPPWVAPALLGSQLFPYVALNFPTECTSTESATLPPTDYAFGPMGADLLPVSGVGGDATIVYRLDGSSSDGNSTGICPGEAPIPGATCSYTITGTLTLTLVRQVGGIAALCKSSATLARRATKAVVRLRCPVGCHVKIGLTPLKGAPAVLARRSVKVKPAKATKVTLPIPAKKRRLVQKARGVRIQLTYRCGAIPPFSETRTAHL